MRAVVIGFPKSGTSTIQRALVSAGLRSVHWKLGERHVGPLVYEGLLRRGDPLAMFPGVDALTQMDVCLPGKGLNHWPNLDFNVLLAIRRLHPGCLLVLNRRDPQAIARSMVGWNEMNRRLARLDVPGLPAGFGASAEDLVAWIENHYRAAAMAFAGDPRFLDLDIAAAEAPARLGAALGVEIRWWGVANSTEEAIRTGRLVQKPPRPAMAAG
jgi:hypothetical protein